jgi:hypothetical protein
MVAMLWIRAHFALTASALCLLGCSGEPVEPLSGPSSGNGGGAGVASGGGGGASSGSGAGGMGAGQAGAGAGGVPTAGSGGVASCNSFADDTGYTLLVHIKNEMSQPLYLGPEAMGCSSEPLFSIEDGARTKLTPLNGCMPSCQAVMAGSAAACPAVCATPATVALEPGQTIDLPWDGRFGVPQTLPSQCMKDATLANSCMQAQKIEAGVFTFLARAGTKRECLLAGGACTCASNTNGGCTAASSLIGGTIYTSEFLVALEPGELSPAGEPQYIGIVFRD